MGRVTGIRPQMRVIIARTKEPEKGRRHGNRRDLGDVQRARPPTRGYPTEKPVALLRTLIAQSSQPGELVLDPFCGSGNVGKVARARAPGVSLRQRRELRSREITSRSGRPGGRGSVTK